MPKIEFKSMSLPKFNFSKKIGMNLGIEYLVRSGIVREFIKFPCSIFVKSGEEKIAVTINKANIQDDENCVLYSVRNWFISECDEKQPIPSMDESIVRDVDLFHSTKVVIRGFSPIYFDCNSIEWKRNRGNNGHPMPDYIYEDYFHKMLSPTAHKIKKENFLWGCFTKAYIPSVHHMVSEKYNFGEYLGGSPRSSTFLKQQKLVEENFRAIWWAWLKWKKFMIFDTVPGELIFMRDYTALS